MAYDEALAARVRAALTDRAGVSERRMFGGLALMQHGNMVCGVVGVRLMLRLGEAGADAALGEPHVSAMDFTGRPMASMVYVEPEGIADDRSLAAWLERALRFSETLPPKV